MFGPLLGAVAARRAEGQRGLEPTGAFRVNAWWAVARFAPLAYTAAALCVSLALPGLSLNLDPGSLLDRFGRNLPPEALEQGRARIAALPGWVLPVVFAGQSLVAGATVNAAAAFGEEYGWRGYLHEAWAPLGPWRASLSIGALWGARHLPLVLMGHNYPQHPALGALWVIAWCTLMGPLFFLLRARTGSAVAPAIAHGTLNACGGMALLFVRGGNDPTAGITGLPGIAVAALAVALLAWRGGLRAQAGTRS